MPDPSQSFFWVGGQAVTADQLAQMRAIAEAKQQQAQGEISNPWEGASSAINNVTAALLNRKANDQESQARSEYTERFNAIGDAPSRDDLMKLMDSDFATPGQQAVVQALMSQAMTPPEPYKADMKTFETPDGDVMRWDANDPSGQPSMLYDAPAKPAGAPDLVELYDEETGLPYKARWDAVTGEYVRVGGNKAPSDSLVTVNTGENSSAFGKKSDELAAVRLGDTVAAGSGAQEFTANLNALKDIAAGISTGKEAEIKTALGPYAEALGFSVEGLGEMQAYQAIIDKLAPQMRVPGSGSSSDIDVRMFLSSLPALGKTPEGNAIIIQTFEAIQQHKIAAAEIASRAFLPPEDGGITWQEAEKQIRALGDPYSAFKQASKAVPNEPEEPGSAEAIERPAPPKAGDIVDGYRFNGGDPGDPNSWSKV